MVDTKNNATVSRFPVGSRLTAVAGLSTLAMLAVPAGANAASLLPPLPTVPPVTVGNTTVQLPGIPPALAQQLQQLTGITLTNPTPQALTGPLADTIDRLAATQGLPAQAAGVLAQLSASLRSASPPTPAQVAALLQQLAATPGLPPLVAGGLRDVAVAIGSGLPPTSPALAGAVASLIDRLAGTQGLPPGVVAVLNQLSDALRSSNPPSLPQVSSLLAQLAGTPGVPQPFVNSFSSLSDVLGTPGAGGQNGGSGQPGGAGGNGTNGAGGIPGFAGPNPFGPGFNPFAASRDAAAARAYGGVIKSVRYNAKKRSLVVVVYCSAARTACNTAVSAYNGRRRVAKPAAKTIRSHKSVTFKMGLTTATTAAIRKRTTTLTAVAVSNTPYGQAHSTKSLRIKSHNKGRSRRHR